VVVGRNEGERLLRCLASLKHLTGRLVDVNSASADGSFASARSLGADVVILDMERPFTAARARAGGGPLERLTPGLEYVILLARNRRSIS
jgi:hypothetical protein